MNRAGGAVAEAEETASQRGCRVIDILCEQGKRLGFDVAREYPVQGGRLDVVWLLPHGTAIPGVEAPLPTVGFEVESSSYEPVTDPNTAWRILLPTHDEVRTYSMISLR